MTKLRAGIVSALDDRIAGAEKKFNRASALAAVETARELDVAPATVAGFASRAQHIPAAGEKLPGDDHMRLVRVGDRIIAAASTDVTRADYARFAIATGRPAALCRERTSLLRLLAPRSWKAPGFAQSAAHPVVCVSWSDATAYANWMAQRSGHRYRLPTDAEARVLPNAAAATPVSTWLEDCTAGCRQRLAAGRSWRGTAGMRQLDPGRGYDDVGFRLVRDQ